MKVYQIKFKGITPLINAVGKEVDYKKFEEIKIYFKNICFF